MPNNMVKINLEDIKKELIPVLEKYPEIAGAYLFGSALDCCRPDSDIDIGLIIDDEKKYSDQDCQLIIEKILRTLSPINKHQFDLVILKSSEAIFSFRVIRNGTLIYNRDNTVVTDFIEKVSQKYRKVYPRYNKALEMIISEG